MKELTKLDRVERVLWAGASDPEIRAELQDAGSEARRLADASAEAHARIYDLVDPERVRRYMSEEERLHADYMDELRREASAEGRVPVEDPVETDDSPIVAEIVSPHPAQGTEVHASRRANRATDGASAARTTRRRPSTSTMLLFGVSIVAILGWGAAGQQRNLNSEITEELAQSRGELKTVRAELAEERRRTNTNELAKPLAPRQQPGQPKPATPSDQLYVMAYDPENFAAFVEAGGTVRVTVQNVIFPCTLRWIVDGVEHPVEIPLAGASLNLPAGRVRIAFEPKYGNAWYQPFSIVHNKKYLGGAPGSVVLNLADRDTLRIHLDHPYPPWNSVLIPIKGHWALVTLLRADAGMDVDKYQNGTWPGSDLPNTMLCWAKYGTAGLARELAQSFVDHVKSGNVSGNVRTKLNTAIVVPSDDKGVVEGLRDLRVDDLIPVLTEAFELLRKQRAPGGKTVQSELDRAKGILKDLPIRK